MAKYGYGYVADEGFIGFRPELGQNAWGTIKLDPSFSSGKHIPVTPDKLTLEQGWKLQLATTLDALARATGTDNDPASDSDSAWDSTQRKVDFQTAYLAESDDPNIRAAAKRVREKLLRGEGIEQTTLSYQKEVDFGRAQVGLANKELAADIKLLGLGNLIAEISARTEALADALGRGRGDARRVSRSMQIREARSECVSVCSTIHKQLDWWIDSLPPGPQRDRLINLRAPLVALIERYTTSNTPPSNGSEGEGSGGEGGGSGDAQGGDSGGAQGGGSGSKSDGSSGA